MTGYDRDINPVLDISGTAVSHTGDTNETTLYTYTMPGGTMGANGMVRITALWSFTNSANSKTMRIKFGGSNLRSSALTAKATESQAMYIINRNSETSQLGKTNFSNYGSASTASVQTYSIDTSADVDITFTATLASAGETITLECALIELLK